MLSFHGRVLSSLARTANLEHGQVRVKQTLLVLGHILISAEQVAGGFFQPANPTAQDTEDRAASLTLLLPGGQVTVTDDAAIFLWEHLVQNYGTQIGALDHVMISKDAVRQLKGYFSNAHPTQSAAHSCKAIVDQLAQRIV